MISRFLVAIAFLTIIPVPRSRLESGLGLEKSLVFFPLIGMGIGLGAVGCGYLFVSFFSQPVAAVLVCTFLLAISGALHMDGVADTADGFFSARPRERILEIMRDSHTGAMGVIAIVLILALKIAALATCSQKVFLVAAFLMPVAGRVSILLLMAILPYARTGGGLGSLFYSGSVKNIAGVMSFILLAVFWVVAGVAGYAVLLLLLVMLLFFSWVCRKKIGGATGDTLGAGCELAETVVALALSFRPLADLIG